MTSNGGFGPDTILNTADDILGTADDVLDSQVTDGNGQYLFIDLAADQCEVTVDVTTALPKILGICPTSVLVTLQPGDEFLDADFCFVELSAVGDFVWCDIDNGGVQDPNEPGVPDITIELLCAGRDSSATVTSQPSDKWNHAGDPGFAENVFVRSSDDSDPFETDADTSFEETVTLNSEFVINTANAGEDRFGSRTYVHVFESTGTNLLQSVEFHTWRQPLLVGDQYGSMRIITCTGESTPIPGDCCSNGRPASLTFIYTGESYAATSTTQDPGKVECSGDPAGAATVYSFAKDDDHFHHSHGHFWFEGPVTLGENFVLDAANAGEDKLENETFIAIYDVQGGTILQQVEFHTSCSQPLFVGNQFGASLLVDCVGENE